MGQDAPPTVRGRHILRVGQCDSCLRPGPRWISLLVAGAGLAPSAILPVPGTLARKETETLIMTNHMLHALRRASLTTGALAAALGTLALTADLAAAAWPCPVPAPTCLGRPATLCGTAGNDTILGTIADEVIVGLGGNDTIRGAGGNDVICGDEGNDRLFGANGDDVLFGGDGNDELFGGTGADNLRGGPGKDTLSGAAGNDLLAGGAGQDSCDGGSRNNDTALPDCETLLRIP